MCGVVYVDWLFVTVKYMRMLRVDNCMQVEPQTDLFLSLRALLNAHAEAVLNILIDVA